MTKRDPYQEFSKARDETSQLERAFKRPDQVPNSDGGFVWQITKWEQLQRFLILGSAGGTYYIGQRQLTRDNASAVIDCLEEDGQRVVQMIVDVSKSGRAPSNDPALFALALAISHGLDGGQEDQHTNTRQAAANALPQVARISTHLFHFITYARGLRDMGRVLRDAIIEWYTQMEVSDLAYQVTKYQSRDGWSHRDVLRLVQPNPFGEQHDLLFRWVVDGLKGREAYTGEGYAHTSPRTALEFNDERLPQMVQALERLKLVPTARQVIDIITADDELRIPRELIPTKWLKVPEVWEALLPHMPYNALIRNLGKMSQVGLLTPNSKAATRVIEKLTRGESIARARAHPLKILVALKMYARGAGLRGSLTWDPVPRVVDALDDAFYISFGAIMATGKRILFGMDISPSMGQKISGIEVLSCAEANAALAMTLIRTEPNAHCMAFTSGLANVGITPKTALPDAIDKARKAGGWGGTDCALPMTWAGSARQQYDAFLIGTDSETNTRESIHPFEALKAYRRKHVAEAKLIVAAMTSNSFTIADPRDGGMLDVVGFDTGTPQLIHDFIGG